MAYFLNIFSPETYEAFGRSEKSISGFRPRQANSAKRVKPGDTFVCYMTKLSRWVGTLEVEGGPFNDDTPIFLPSNDPYVLRFRVRPLVWLTPEKCVPIFEDSIWKKLSFTRDQTRSSLAWRAKFQTSLASMTDADGRLLEAILKRQASGGTSYPLSEVDLRKAAAHRLPRKPSPPPVRRYY